MPHLPSNHKKQINYLFYLVFWILHSVAWAGLEQNISQFQQQMIAEAPIVADFLSYVQATYSSTHSAFQNIGARDPQSKQSLAASLSPNSTIANLFAEVVPADRYGTAYIQVTVQFKDMEHSERTNVFFANSSIVFTATGSLGQAIQIPINNQSKKAIEPRIIGFTCRKIYVDDKPPFASLAHGSDRLDLSPSLSYPFNICTE